MRCPVCKADLSLLYALEERRVATLAEARRALAEGRLSEALDEAEQARRLRAGGDVGRLLAVIALLRGDFARAQREYEAQARAG